MRPSALAAFGVFALAASEASAQMRLPAPGSAEHAAVLAAVRPVMVVATRGPIAFDVDRLSVDPPYAFVSAKLSRPDGTEISRDGTIYAGWEWDGFYLKALLVHGDGRWHVAEHDVGATDMHHTAWSARWGFDCDLIVDPADWIGEPPEGPCP